MRTWKVIRSRKQRLCEWYCDNRLLDAWTVKEIFRGIMRRMYFENPGKVDSTRLKRLLCLKNKVEIGSHLKLDIKLG